MLLIQCYVTDPDEDLDKRREEPGGNDCLDLIGVPGGDVGHGPRRLLHEVHPGVLQEFAQGGQGPRLDDGVGLLVRAGYNVAQRPEQRFEAVS